MRTNKDRSARVRAVEYRNDPASRTPKARHWMLLIAWIRAGGAPETYFAITTRSQATSS